MSKSHSLVEKIITAKHGITGQDVAKSVLKATKDEITVPKRKHLDYLVVVTDNPNINILDMSKLLLDRAHNQKWTVCFKALLSIHHIMNYGNDVFFQHMATNSFIMSQGSFSDTTSAISLHMSKFVRTYTKYVTSKAATYRTMGFDFCKVKKGNDESYFGTLEPPQLLEPLLRLQAQIDDLLAFKVFPGELSNEIIKSAYVHLSKDLARLYTCYKDAINNLSRIFLHQERKFCKEGLSAYKKYLEHEEKIHDFFEMSEEAGMNRFDIPKKSETSPDKLKSFEDHVKALDNYRRTSSNLHLALPKPEDKSKTPSSKRPSEVSEQIIDLLCNNDTTTTNNYTTNNNKNNSMFEASYETSLETLEKNANSIFNDDFFATGNSNNNDNIQNIGFEGQQTLLDPFKENIFSGNELIKCKSTATAVGSHSSDLTLLDPAGFSSGIGSILEPKKLQVPPITPLRPACTMPDINKLSLNPATPNQGRAPCYDVYFPPTTKVYPTITNPFSSPMPGMMHPGHFDQLYTFAKPKQQQQSNFKNQFI